MQHRGPTKVGQGTKHRRGLTGSRSRGSLANTTFRAEKRAAQGSNPQFCTEQERPGRPDSIDMLELALHDDSRPFRQPKQKDTRPDCIDMLEQGLYESRPFRQTEQNDPRPDCVDMLEQVN